MFIEIINFILYKSLYINGSKNCIITTLYNVNYVLCYLLRYTLYKRDIWNSNVAIATRINSHYVALDVVELKIDNSELHIAQLFH